MILSKPCLSLLSPTSCLSAAVPVSSSAGCARHSGGNFFEPTVLGRASIDMRVFREETFGPLIPLFKVSSDEEAVKLANNTEYGLAG